MRATCPLRRPSGTGSARISLPFPHPGQKLPRLEARSCGVDGSGVPVGVAQGGRDGREWHTGGDGCDAEAVPETLRTGLGPSMPASVMSPAIFRWAVARDLAPTLGAALQGPDPDRGALEVDVPGANGQGFGNPGAGMGEREGEGLVGWPRRPGGGLEETPAFIGCEVLAAAGVDELEIAD